jgi:hypothetical protein
MSVTKEYALSMLECLAKLEAYRTISPSQMQDGFGKYWATIFDELRKRVIISDNSDGSFYVNTPYIPALQTEYQHALATIEREEEEQRMRLDYMKADIKRVKQAICTARISIFISAAAIVVSILAATVWK